MMAMFLIWPVVDLRRRNSRSEKYVSNIAKA